jgi:hypothetical protein
MRRYAEDAVDAGFEGIMIKELECTIRVSS